jgi:hypothetical protein
VLARPPARGTGRGARLEAVLDELQSPVEVARLDRPDKGVDHRRDLPTSPGVMAPSASAGVTAFIAAAISAGLSIVGSSNLTARSRHGGRMRSTQSRMAIGSSPSASSTTLRVKASDSPASSVAAAIVALLRQPGRRPGRIARPALFERSPSGPPLRSR